MKTILYNKDTKQIKHHAKEGYYTITTSEGGTHRPEIPEPWVELVYENTPKPIYDINEYKISFEWVIDLQAKTYTKTWTIIALTQYEKDVRAWGNMNYAKKLEIDKSFIFTPVGASYLHWFDLLGLDRFYDEDTGKLWVYIETVEGVNQGGLSQYLQDNTIIVHSRPVES